MSYRVVDGQLVSDKKLPHGVSAPTPAQIAERAYELAKARALEFLRSSELRAQLEEVFVTWRQADLAALRDSVIRPEAVPWWKK